jgi:hypothetical protein
MFFLPSIFLKSFCVIEKSFLNGFKKKKNLELSFAPNLPGNTQCNLQVLAKKSPSCRSPVELPSKNLLCQDPPITKAPTDNHHPFVLKEKIIN